MRIEFCEADVLAVFDDWRRAVGLTASQVAEETSEFAAEGEAAEARPTPRKGPLAAHIQRCVARLLAPKAEPDAAFDGEVQRITAELDTLAGLAVTARGEARVRITDRLASLDSELLEAAKRRVNPRLAVALQAEADAELSGFAGRMPAEGLARARRLAIDRLTREAFNLPVLSVD